MESYQYRVDGSVAEQHKEKETARPGGRSTLGRLANGSLALYALSLLGWAIVRPIVGDRSVLVLLGSYLGVWLFSPVLVFGPWVLFNPGKVQFLLLAIPTLLFLRLYGPLFHRVEQNTGKANDPLTILTHNLQYTNQEVVAIGRILLASQADVLALQEVTLSHWEGLRDTFSDRYPFCSYHASEGLAVYSRFPILSEDVIMTGSWSAQSVVIQKGQVSFHLVNAHLARVGIMQLFGRLSTRLMRHSARARVNQIQQIQATIRQVGLPAIVTCDCNMTSLMSSYCEMTQGLRDAQVERGCGLGHTFMVPRGLEIRSPLNVPVLRLDYVFHSPSIQATGIQVISQRTGSDHLPVVAQFDLAP